jgi:hypothetical protein
LTTIQVGNNFIEEIMPNSILFVFSYSLPCSRFNYPFDKHCYLANDSYILIIEYTECDDTFAYEEDDEAEERPLLELSSDGEDQHEAGMYVIFKMIRI